MTTNYSLEAVMRRSRAILFAAGLGALVTGGGIGVAAATSASSSSAPSPASAIRASLGSATIDVISPHTEEVIGRVPEGTTEDMDRAVAAARDAFDNGPWPRLDPVERAEAVGKLADLYAGRLGDFAAIITEEMGSPITFSQLAQAPQPQMMLSYFADLGKTFTWEDERAGFAHYFAEDFV